ncbi:hypothetical protein B5X24_HaOG216044 [Helicoverpa armigera]|nr:hypothetical protein B5X24_HaOG216044 [Helicoverpa armigera]
MRHFAVSVLVARNILKLDKKVGLAIKMASQPILNNSVLQLTHVYERIVKVMETYLLVVFCLTVKGQKIGNTSTTVVSLNY